MIYRYTYSTYQLIDCSTHNGIVLFNIYTSPYISQLIALGNNMFQKPRLIQLEQIQPNSLGRGVLKVNSQMVQQTKDTMRRRVLFEGV